MLDEFVKKIVLEFEAKGTDEMKQKLDKVSGRGSPVDARNLSQYSRQIQDVIKNMEKMGQAPSKSMEKLASTLKDLTNREIKNFYTEMDKTAQRIERRMEALKRMEAKGASEETLSRVRGRQGRDLELLESKAANAPPPLTPPPTPTPTAGAGAGTTLGGVIGAAAAAEAAFETEFIKTKRTEFSYKAAAASPILRQQRAALSGSIKDALLETTIQSSSKAMDQAEEEIDAQKNLMWAKLAAGAATAAGSVPLLGAGGLGLAGIAAGSAWTVSSAGDLWRFYRGGREAAMAQAKEKYKGDIEAASLMPDLIDNFEKEAPARFHYQKLLNMNDQSYHTSIRGIMQSAALSTTDEARQLALGMRGYGFDGGETTELAKVAGQVSLRSKMDLGATAQLTGQAALLGTGGTTTAKKTLEDIGSVGTAVGIKNSGLLEEFNKMTMAMASQAGVKQDISALSSQIARFIVPGAGGKVDLTALQGAEEAQGLLSGLVGSDLGAVQLTKIQRAQELWGKAEKAGTLKQTGTAARALFISQYAAESDITAKAADVEAQYGIDVTGENVELAKKLGGMKGLYTDAATAAQWAAGGGFKKTRASAGLKQAMATGAVGRIPEMLERLPESGEGFDKESTAWKAITQSVSGGMKMDKMQQEYVEQNEKFLAALTSANKANEVALNAGVDLSTKTYPELTKAFNSIISALYTAAEDIKQKRSGYSGSSAEGANVQVGAPAAKGKVGSK
jgi:hypothetical protein